LRLQVLLGSFPLQFGCLFLAAGILACRVFLPHVDLGGDRFGTSAERVDGRVVSCAFSGFSENKHPVVEVRFEYQPKGAQETIIGKSYIRGDCPALGATIPVEYVRDAPSVARVVGGRERPLGPLGAGVLVFPVVGAVLVAVGLRRSRRDAWLLVHGDPVEATLVERRLTNVRVNRKPVVAWVFEYRARDGREARAEVRSHRSPPDGDRAWLLADPRDPGRVVALFAMPGQPRPGLGGTIEGAGAWLAALLLVPPVAVLAAALWTLGS